MRKGKLKKALLCVAGIAAAERIMREADDRKYPAPGRMVYVDGKRMHVRIGGQGRTLVFLPGLGTAVPSVDFMPLAQRLQEDFRCVIPEPFGYGWSDGTAEPRTVENIVAEIRAGLRAAEIRPPYLLLGHSVAGLYIRWWACRYPEEVAGIIGDDPSVPEQAMETEMTVMLPDHGLPLAGLKAASMLAPLGLGRVASSLSREVPYLTGGDPTQLAAVRARAARCWCGRAIVSEYEQFRANAEKAGAAFPTCPVLVFVANGPGSCGQMHFESGFSWVEQHQKMAQQAERGQCVVLPGGHYLHWQFADEMADAIRAFFSQV